MTVRICLVSPGHIASNPRLVKEANALYQAGYDVRVVAANNVDFVRPLDKAILKTAPWRYQGVEAGSRLIYGSRVLRQRLARRIARSGWVPSLSVAVWGNSWLSGALAKAAMAEPADLFIAHCLAALPAAWQAARHYGSRLGFDAEDFHTAEGLWGRDEILEVAIRDRIERQLLPECTYRTAASPGIAEAYKKRYGLPMISLLNVFSRSEAPLRPRRQPGDRTSEEISLYWFSQTVGKDRGLEPIVQAIGLMRIPVRLHIRGFPAPGYPEQLQRLAGNLGVAERIHLMAPAPPDQMVALASCHDLGLSLELTTPYNRAICLTNKIFAYLLAGIPVLLSDTPSHRELAPSLGEAALLVNLQDPKQIAKQLDDLFSDSSALQRLRALAWQLGQERYNWEIEQNLFLQQVKTALSHT